MKASKKRTGTKLKLSKGKRVSLRCPLSIEQTDIEYNYDASALQVCMTVENMGGGGLSSDTVTSAVIVVRLYDSEGKVIPCMGDSEYFAKLLRFGDEGLAGGARITFRLTPDCGPEGLRTEDVEVYISRVRYSDDMVTDYVRGDFFDFPDNGVPISKRFKKKESEVVEALGEGATYVPEHLTEIVWRCTCGEFSESDTCPSCGRNKAKLFAALGPFVGQSGLASDTASGNSAQAINGATLPPVTEQTAEYPTGPALAAAKAAMESEEAAPPVHPPRPETQPKKSDKTKMVLLVSISAAAVVLGVLILMLALTIFGRSKPADTTTQDPATIEPSPSDAGEQIVRSYMKQHDYKNALGYAQSVGVSEKLIDEIFDTAIAHYTEQHLYEEALEWAELANDEEIVITLRAILFSQKLAAEDYEGAIALANTLPEGQREALLAEAASGYVNSLVAQGKYEEAMALADQYHTELTSAQIAASAIDGHLQNHEFDTAIALAQQLNLADKVTECQKAAADFYIGLADYDRAVGYARAVGDSALLQKIFPHLSDLQIRRNLPAFFSFLTFEQKQAFHAAPISSNPQKIVAIDTDGNVYEGGQIVYYAEGGGSPAVSVACSDTTIVALLENGTLYYIKGYNGYFAPSDVAEWTNIVAISMSNYHILGLTESGEVVAAGKNTEGQCNVAAVSNAVAIAAGDNHSVILRADGTVVALGTEVGGICNTGDWTDIVAISAGSLHTVGLRADGTAVSLGNCEVSEWSDVIAISSRGNNAVGLQVNGNLVYSAAGVTSDLLAGVPDAIWVSAGKSAIVVLHADGTLTSHGQNAPDPALLAEVQRKTEVFGMR